MGSCPDTDIDPECAWYSYWFILLRPGGKLSLGKNFGEPCDGLISLISTLCTSDF